MLTLNKKIFAVFFAVLLLTTFEAHAIVPKTKVFYVNDSANILSRETKEYILKMNVDLHSKTGAQIVVVTVKNLEGRSIEDYALELFRSYGIGSHDKNNGVLFLVSIGERETRIEVGYGLEGRITDGKAGRILDNYVIPYFKSDDWDNGVKNGFNAILEEVSKEYSISVSGAVLPQSRDTGSNEPISVTSTIIVLIIASNLNRRFSGKKKYIAAFGVALAATAICGSVYGTGSILAYLLVHILGALLAVYFLPKLGVSVSGSFGGGGFSGGGSSGGGGSSRGF